jgi:hypothetical protein
MLTPLFAQAFEPVTGLVEPFVAGWTAPAPQVLPIALPGEPPTIQLALVGIATLVAYSIAGRIWRRPAKAADNRGLAGIRTGTDASADAKSTSREAA